MKHRIKLISSLFGLIMLLSSLTAAADGFKSRTDTVRRVIPFQGSPQSSVKQDSLSLPVSKKTVLAFKSNLLYDVALMPNISMEIPVGQRFSLLAQSYWPWWLSQDNRYCFQIRSLGFEGRWWFSRRHRGQEGEKKWRDRLSGHFLGVYGISGSTDFQLEEKYCVQAQFWSTGLTYGYSLPIGGWMNLEFALSAGYARIPWQKYVPSSNWQDLFRDTDNYGTMGYFGPTKLEISLVLPITKRKKH